MLERNSILHRGCLIMILFFAVLCTINLFLSCEICKAKDGNTLYVGRTGDYNYASIQDAIDNSQDNDIVFVYDGTYIENLVVNKSIDLIGSNKNNVTITGNDGLYTILIKSSGVTISGFTIQNSNVGIFVSGSEFSFNNISDNIITNNYEGIRLMNSSNNNVIDNIIQHHSDFGIVLYESKNNVILRNTFNDNSKGVFLGRWSDNNLISENNLTDYTFGIYLDYSFDNLLIDNLITNGDYGIYLTYSKDNNIMNNSIEYNEQTGVYISNSDENVISPNTFLNNYQDVKKESEPPGIKTPGFEMLLVFCAILLAIFLRQNS